MSRPPKVAPCEGGALDDILVAEFAARLARINREWSRRRCWDRAHVEAAKGRKLEDLHV